MLFPCLSPDMQRTSLPLHPLFQQLREDPPFSMVYKRKLTAAASPEPDSSRGNRSVPFAEPKPNKRVKFELSQTLFHSASTELSPTSTAIVNPPGPPRRIRRRTRMAEHADDQLRDPEASEDWSGIEDREERRRVQNRISQRKFSKFSHPISL